MEKSDSLNCYSLSSLRPPTSLLLFDPLDTHKAGVATGLCGGEEQSSEGVLQGRRPRMQAAMSDSRKRKLTKEEKKTRPPKTQKTVDTHQRHLDSISETLKSKARE